LWLHVLALVCVHVYTHSHTHTPTYTHTHTHLCEQIFDEVLESEGSLLRHALAFMCALQHTSTNCNTVLCISRTLTYCTLKITTLVCVCVHMHSHAHTHTYTHTHECLFAQIFDEVLESEEGLLRHALAFVCALRHTSTNCNTVLRLAYFLIHTHNHTHVTHTHAHLLRRHLTRCWRVTGACCIMS